MTNPVVKWAAVLATGLPIMAFLFGAWQFVEGQERRIRRIEELNEEWLAEDRDWNNTIIDGIREILDKMETLADVIQFIVLQLGNLVR